MMLGAADEAERLKGEANKLFAGTLISSIVILLAKYWTLAGKFSEADELYSKAIELNPKVPAYWSNRSFTNFKLENYGYSIVDATEAIQLDPTFIKVTLVIMYV
jgi:tetratricopeptide (TPR) repeat protein